jgi:hypothetical protein
MLRLLTLCVCIVSLFFASYVAIAQTEFSADAVSHKQSGSTIDMKLYFGKDKMRFDTEKGSEDQATGIVNLSTQTVTVLMKQQHMYMEMPMQMAAQRLMYNFFRTGDVENACGDWQRIVKNQGGTCHKVGHDTVNGRNAVKYEGTNSRGESGSFWIDVQLRFPVKWQDNKGNSGGELRNIQEGPQPASLFEVPPGYTKFDMGGMRQQR